MTILDIPQHLETGEANPEWLQARAGKVTASRIADVMAKIKTGEAAARADYKAQIVAEILTRQPQGSIFSNEEMRHGVEQEPYARAAYEHAKRLMVDEVGMIIHSTIDRGAASPDGLVEFDGMVEIKCPKTATHISTILAGEVPAKYATNQIQWQMACSGRDWCDFVSYDPRLPEDLQLFVKRVKRDNARIAEIEGEVKAFLAEVDEMVANLRARMAA